MIIDDLLDTTRLITGKLSLTAERQKLKPILLNLLESSGPEFEAKKISVQTDFKHLQ